jgi:hypothetical protein
MSGVEASQVLYYTASSKKAGRISVLEALETFQGGVTGTHGPRANTPVRQASFRNRNIRIMGPDSWLSPE